MLIAALALTTVRAGIDRWVSAEAMGGENDSPVPYIERSWELLRTLITCESLPATRAGLPGRPRAAAVRSSA